MTNALLIIFGLDCLVITFLVGWFIICPILEWIGAQVLSLAIKGADYRRMVEEMSGRERDPSA